MSFLSIKNLIPNTINRANIKRQVSAAQVCSAFNDYIKNQKSLDQSKAFFYKNKVLTISVPTSAHAQEIQAQAHIIREKINKQFKQILVERIQFKII